jgi:hypothetical protein
MIQNHWSGGHTVNAQSYGKKSIVWQAVPITNFRSKRMCAVGFKFPSGIACLLIDIYMPCDFMPGNMPEYRSYILDEISGIAVSTGADHLIIGGDYNTDFSRDSQNSRSLALLVPFIVAEGLEKASTFRFSDIKYTLRKQNHWGDITIRSLSC